MIDASEHPPQHPPNWYPDPLGRSEMRYWDGHRWTEHVASHGRQSIDPPTAPPAPLVATTDPTRVQAQIERHVAAADKRGVAHHSNQAGDGTIWGEPILVVNQKAKVIEVSSEFAVYDRRGNQLGAVRQVGQSTAKKVMRVVGNLDQYFTHKFQVVDMDGNVLLGITRPAKVMKSRLVVTNAVGAEVGEVKQENMVGKIRFALRADGEKIGSINAENWRAWNFSIQDSSEDEVARITKTFEGVAKTMFTTADNYVLQIHRPLVEPLRSLVIASALSVDTALKQDARGLS